MTKVYVSPERAADMLDVSRTTVYKMMNQGQLLSVKIGSSRRIKVSSIAALGSEG